jgi:hypothetical protein
VSKMLELGRLSIEGVRHHDIPAEENQLCDDLSRNRISEWLDPKLRVSGGNVLDLVDPFRASH